MTKKFAAFALMFVGLFLAGTAASFAQTYTSQVRRVAVEKMDQQPVAASAVIANTTSMNLSATQRDQISRLSSEVSALDQERARLWSEYKAVISAPGFDDPMAASQAAPRMRRIVEINSQLSTIVARQTPQLNAILSTQQQSQLSQVVAKVKAEFAH